MLRLGHIAVTVGIACGLALAPVAARADDDGDDTVERLDDDARPTANKNAAAKEKKEGEYGGVKPGNDDGTHSSKPKKRPKAGTLAWVGFAADGGAAEIFLQVPNEVEASQRIEGRTLIVHLDGIKRLGRNVRRPVITRFFDTPVARISVKRVGAKRARKGQPGRKAGADVRIELKAGATPREASVRTATEADGYFYVYLELAPDPGVSSSGSGDGPKTRP